MSASHRVDGNSGGGGGGSEPGRSERITLATTARSRRRGTLNSGAFRVVDHEWGYLTTRTQSGKMKLGKATEYARGMAERPDGEGEGGRRRKRRVAGVIVRRRRS